MSDFSQKSQASADATNRSKPVPMNSFSDPVGNSTKVNAPALPSIDLRLLTGRRGTADRTVLNRTLLMHVQMQNCSFARHTLVK